MEFAELEERLRENLARPLPGADAQERLSPRPRRGWVPGHVPTGLRQSAGLLLLYPREGSPTVLLTLRRADLPQHAGQVSLPGGAAEPGETLVDTALRESREEVGVDPAAVRVLGPLSPLHIPVSGFALHPFVGLSDRRPGLRPDVREVQRILEIPLDALLDPGHVAVETRTLGGRSYQVPFIHLDGEKVWGATAMILAEFLALLGVRAEA